MTGAGVVLGEPPQQRGIEGHKNPEDHLEPADFFLEPVDPCHSTTACPIRDRKSNACAEWQWKE